ncbi:MAG TPA: ATP-binding protein [Bacteroidales bacterium]
MSLNGFSEEQIFERLRYDNPWWVTGKIDAYYNSMRRRLYQELFYPLVKDTSVKRAVILMGPRRVGKTVMIYHSIQSLLEQGINPHKILFISIETPIYNKIPLEQLFNLARRTLGQADDTNGFWVFYDEIQYLKEWEVHLKSLVDSYPYVKFVASGSAAAALKLKSNESGAGRFTDFMLPPLTFNEYIHLKDLDKLIIPSKLNWGGAITEFYDTIDIRQLNEHFLNYINFGGYPEVIFSEQIQSDPGRYIRNDIVDKVLLRDLPSLYGINDVQDLNSMFTTIAYNSGKEFSFENLSKISGVKKELLRKYIAYLEAAFLIKIIHKTDINAKKFQRATQFKIYLTNPSLRSALFAPLHPNDEAMGTMVETAIFAQWLQRQWIQVCYAKWKEGRAEGEVDMVGIDDKNFKPNWAVEIKWSNRYFEHTGELGSLLNFLESNGLSQAIVTTIDKSGDRQLDKVLLRFIPAALYAFVVGKNMLKYKKTRV